MARKKDNSLEESRYDQLSDQHRLFVDCYIDPTRAAGNQTKAAKMAGYSPDSAVNQGYRLMRNDDIREAIREKLSVSTMSAEEALSRLADIARSDLIPFYREIIIADADGKPRPFMALDLTTDAAKENMHLIKAIVPTQSGRKIILHDQQAALTDILKMHGKFVQKLEVSVRDKDYWKQFSYAELQEIKDGIDPDAILARPDR